MPSLPMLVVTTSRAIASDWPTRKVVVPLHRVGEVQDPREAVRPDAVLGHPQSLDVKHVVRALGEPLPQAAFEPRGPFVANFERLGADEADRTLDQRPRERLHHPVGPPTERSQCLDVLRSGGPVGQRDEVDLVVPIQAAQQVERTDAVELVW